MFVTVFLRLFMWIPE